MQHAIDNGHSQHAAGSHDHGHHDQESMKVLGFWIFLVTDCLLFGTLFATYVVLKGHVDGGPTGKELFEIPGFVAETFILLTSSFTSGLAVLAMNKGKVNQLIGWLIVTAVLGASFVGLEINEFVNMVNEGAKISTSAFLTAFFTLVGTHGLHVSVGLIWMIGLMVQLKMRGITPVTRRKITVISLYWHFLDVVWIFLFTIVYLMGVM
ncbi:cytochrome o ubiquinol oxidase subunit III [Paenibacillus sacheonensis]|uniref:Cytochrome bo(3) ubiquinol oxidase subunit 3 n=1 Tax=Paenibacillus sacheonensis TaxID=742054 RepID=A0A7X4YPS0_9BACL|nr:cytochrome o ubiquinol oxidase subunit III [Paenibacillus sacheonensis]MBM7564795.1 cytochrome o ubiquinol oxidase subunit 3 [Paenibacillus sacheonensis]NBC69344.1 cytochrome o ubiquinol oxidase subunit III [Paenibacillus sacheonensis]